MHDELLECGKCGSGVLSGMATQLPKMACGWRVLCPGCNQVFSAAIRDLVAAAVDSLTLDELVQLTLRVLAGDVMVDREYEIHEDHAAHQCRVRVADGAIVAVDCLECGRSALGA